MNPQLILVKNYTRFEALKPDAFAVMASIECEKMDNNEAILKLPTNDVSFYTWDRSQTKLINFWAF